MPKSTKKNDTSIKSCTMYVEGMHCASCELLVEKKLLRQSNVESVEASLKDNSVTFTYSTDKPDLHAVNADLQKFGYQLVDHKPKSARVPLFNHKKNGDVEINPEAIKRIGKSVAVATILLVVFFAFERLQLGRYVSVDNNSSLPAFLALGVVAGLSSCAALIGGLILSMSKNWREAYIGEESALTKATPHIMFHVGRIIALTLFGAALGAVSSALGFTLEGGTVYSIFVIIISVVMFILALQMLGVEWAQKLRFSAPKSVTRMAASGDSIRGKLMPFLTGFMTFLIPCGFTLLAEGVALASGSALRGGLVMLFFALGTMIPLAAISFGAMGLSRKPHLTARFNSVAGLVVIFFVIYNINGQLNLRGLPSLSDIKITLPSATVEVEEGPNVELEVVAVDENGEQVITMEANGFNYKPTSGMTIKSGIPSKLIMNNKGIQGCGAYLAITGLVDNYVALARGENVIDLGLPEKGAYKVTCTMGMVPPVILRVI